jgi:hypothetical protein
MAAHCSSAIYELHLTPRSPLRRPVAWSSTECVSKCASPVSMNYDTTSLGMAESHELPSTGQLVCGYQSDTRVSCQRLPFQAITLLSLQVA